MSTVYQDTFNNLMLAINGPSYSAGVSNYAQGIWVQATVAATVSAKTIVDESPSTTDHALRLAWAKLVLKQPLIYGPLFTYGIMQNSTIIANGTGASTDAQVQAAMDALVPTLVASMVA